MEVKNSKGVTMIALVVTIVVLTILAGITIATLTGDNNIIDKANTASTSTEYAQEREQIESAAVVAASKNLSGMVTKENLEKALDALMGYGTCAVSDYIEDKKAFEVTVLSSGNVHDVKEDGEIVDSVTYTVEHYKQNIDGNGFTLADTENLSASAGDEVTPGVKTYEGFTSPETKTVTINEDGSTVVRYEYTRNTYELTIDPAGGSYSGETSILGRYEATEIIDNPTTVPQGDTTVTFDSNGGNNVSAITAEKSFDRWITEGVGKINGNTYTFGAGDETLTASYKNNSIDLPTPTRDGYTFAGWFTQQTGGNIVNSPYTPTENITLYAHWTAKTDTQYIVNHYRQDLDGTYPDSLKETETLYGTTDAEVTPVVKSYTGFTSPATQTVKINGDGSTVVDYYYERIETSLTINPNGGQYNGKTDNTVITGKYETTTTINDPTVTDDSNLKYEITFDLNGGTYKGSPDQLKVILKQSFSGWTLSDGGSFSGNTYTFGENNGTLTATYSNSPIGSILPEEDPEKDGYEFDGWYTEEGEKVTPDYTPTEDETIHAEWTPLPDTPYTVNHYKENIDNDEYTLDKKETLYGTTDTEVTPGVQTYTGFTSPQTQTVNIDGDGNTVVNYYYDRIETSLTINPNGGKYNETSGNTEISGKYESTIEVNNAEISLSYTITLNPNQGTINSTRITSALQFSGWNHTDGGTFEGSTYKFGTTDGKLTAEYEATAIELPELTKDGYTFTGWFTQQTGGSEVNSPYTPTENTTLYAHWTPKDGTKYTVEHYKQSLEGTYPDSLKETETLYGTTGELVTPDVKTYTGFTSPSLQSATIEGDESTVVEYYYTRNTYELTINPNGGQYDGTTSNTVVPGKYESTTTINDPTVTDDSSINYEITFDLNGGTYNGSPDQIKVILKRSFGGWTLSGGGSFSGNTYTFGEKDGTLTATYSNNPIGSILPEEDPEKDGYEFDGWYTEEGEKVTPDYTPTEDETIHAEWTPIPDTPYTVNHYKENIDNDEYTLDESETLYGTTDTEVTPVVKSYTGFTSPTTQTVKINGDGSTVVDYYYERIETSLTVNPNGGQYNGKTDNTVITGKYETTTTINDPTVTDDSNQKYEIIFDLNGGTYKGSTDQIKLTLKKSFSGWTLSDGGSFSGNTYTFGENNGTLTATYSNSPIGSILPEEDPEKDGYEFDGWYTEDGEEVTPDYTPTEDETIHAEWTPLPDTPYIVNHYKENIDNDEYTLEKKETLYGTTDTKVTPAVESYTGFQSPETQTVNIDGDGNTVVDYYYDRIETSLTIDPNGGKYNEISGNTEISGKYESTIEVNNAEISSSYIITLNPNQGEVTSPRITSALQFSGWNHTDGGTFEGSTYKFGTTDGKLTAEYEATATELPEPTRDGYTFAGWFTQQTGGNKIDSPYTPEEDITLYAHWTANSGTKYTVNYYQQNINDDNYTLVTTETESGTTGESAPTSTERTFEGFNYSHSDADPDNYIIQGDESTVVNYYYTRIISTLTIDPDGGQYDGKSENTEIKGKYESDTDIDNPTPPQGYTVTFNSNGGSDVSSITSTKSFAQWILSGDGELNGTKYIFGADNGTLTATYTDNSIEELPEPTRDGYTFAGWYTQQTGGDKIDSPYTPTANTELYAHWTAIEYTITYNLNEGSASGNPYKYTIETETITLNNPTRPGYIFTGWTGSNGSTPQTSVTIPKGSTGNKEYTANWVEAVASVTTGGTTTYYLTLQEAFDATSTSSSSVSTVTLLQNITLTRTATFASGKNAILDIQDLTITGPDADYVIINQGNLKIQGDINGKIYNTGTGMGIQNASKLEISDITIEMNQSVDYSATISNNGELIINSGTITANATSGTPIIEAILNNSDANTKILGGTIKSDYFAIENNGTLTLGDIEGTPNTETPLIQSEYIGITTNETFNFYDGKIIGSNSGNGAISGTISDTPDGYYPIHDTTSESGKDIVTLGEAVASVTTSNVTTYYMTLKDAFNATSTTSTNPSTITVLKDITGLSDTATFPSGRYAELDLNRKTISKSTSGYTITNSGTLTIIGSGTISNTNSSSTNLATPLNNQGTLTVGEEGGANEDNPTITGYYGIRNRGSSSSSRSTLTVNSGTITGRNYGIYNYYGNATVTGGNISAGTNTSTSSTYGIYNYYASVTVTGGNISAEISATASSNVYGRGIFNTSNGTLTLGTLDSNTPLTTPTITGTSYGVYRSSGTFNYYDGTIIGSQSLGAIYGTVTATPTGYYPISSYSGNKETVTLGKAVASVTTGSATRYYLTLQDAFDVTSTSSSSVSTVKPLQNITLTSTATFPSDNYATLDLDGKTISKSNSGYTIQNEGSLTITGNGTISNTYSSSTYLATPLYNQGTLTVGEEGGANEDNPTITGCYGIRNRGSSSSSRSTLTVNSGTITGRNYGIYNYYGNATVTGGNISAGTNTSTSSTSGIYNAYGSATVTGGNISAKASSTDDGIGINNGSSGTLTLGELDSNTPLTTPTITGTSYGLFINSGTSYYYDGTIIGSSDKGAIYRTLTDYPDEYGYYPIYSYSNNQETVTLQKAVARIGTTYYTTLQDAFDATTSATTTTYLLADITLEEQAVFASGHYTTLNMNGHTIEADLSGNGWVAAILNQGNLKITGTGSIKAENDTGIENKGTLSLSGNVEVIGGNAGVSNIGDFTMNNNAYVFGNNYGIIMNMGNADDGVTGKVTVRSGTVIGEVGAGINVLGSTSTKEAILTIGNNSDSTVSATNPVITCTYEEDTYGGSYAYRNRY